MANISWVVSTNRERDLYLTDGDSVFFISQGWCDDWSYADGFTGGLDWTPEHDDMADGPEIYCYAPINIGPDSESETMFIPVSDLENMREVTEQEAHTINPKLFVYLNAINKGEL